MDLTSYSINPTFSFTFAGEQFSAITAADQALYSSFGRRMLCLLQFYLEPHSQHDGIDAGYSRAEIEFAIAERLIVDSQTAEQLKVWDRHRWNRVATLVFSQFNPRYIEPHKSEAYIWSRRGQLAEYDREGSWPTITFPAGENDSRRIRLPQCETAPVDLKALLKRRTCRKFGTASLSFNAFARILRGGAILLEKSTAMQDEGGVSALKARYCWLRLFVCSQAVENVPRGLYEYDSRQRELVWRANAVSTATLARCTNQPWVAGGGFCLFLVARWEPFMWLYRHSRAYLKLLIRVGEIAQTYVTATYLNGAACCITPAVNETVASMTLGLEAKIEDAVYCIKIGIPSSTTTGI